MANKHLTSLEINFKGTAERIELLEAAYADAFSALRYIRSHYGTLYGVGWDRLERTNAKVSTK